MALTARALASAKSSVCRDGGAGGGGGGAGSVWGGGGESEGAGEGAEPQENKVPRAIAKNKINTFFFIRTNISFIFRWGSLFQNN
jgi:hypothetical protein